MSLWRGAQGPEGEPGAWRVWPLALAAVIVLGLVAGLLVAELPRHSRPAPSGDAEQGTNANPVTGSPFAFPSVTGTAGTSQGAGSGALVGTGALGAGAPTAPWVAQENAKPGTTDWRLTKPAMHHEIEGYAGAVSIDTGGSVSLYVSTMSPTFTVTAYRMGYYGGADGREVWATPTVTGVQQPSFTVTPVTNMVEDAWASSLSVQTDASWPPGDYLFKLTATSGFQSYIPLTIRDDASHAAYLIDSDVTTWQAYNLYGGYDLYNGPGGFSSRSRIVSFDRPYTLGPKSKDFGSADFLGNELHLVSLAESLGLDVSYSTDVDLDQHPELVTNHKVFISLGHDEYYSLVMRNGLQSALNAGVNLMFLGANAIYRHIRFQPSPLGPDRHEIDYKSAAEDPLNGKDPADVTPVAWRDPPNNNPESVIIGDYYQCNPVQADMVITDPSSWIFAGTTVGPGTHLANLVGTEYDHYDPTAPGPRNVTVLARSPLVCGHKADYADMTYYTAPSGGGVFASGTLNWVPDMNPLPDCATPCPGPTVTRVTENVLAAFGGGPAGVHHPSSANAVATGIPSPTVSPSPSTSASAKPPAKGRSKPPRSRSPSPSPVDTSLPENPAFGTG